MIFRVIPEKKKHLKVLFYVNFMYFMNLPPDHPLISCPCIHNQHENIILETETKRDDGLVTGLGQGRPGWVTDFRAVVSSGSGGC